VSYPQGVSTETSLLLPRPSAARERLLDAASGVFYSEGIHAVGVDRLIAEAGVTRATFYRHFPGKEDLVVAYLDRIDGQLSAMLDRRAEDADPAGLLRALAGAVADDLCGRQFRGCPFIHAAAEFPNPDSPVHQLVVRHRAALARAVTDAFTALGHPQPGRAARALLTLRDGAQVAGYLESPEVARTVLQEGLETLLAQCPGQP